MGCSLFFERLSRKKIIPAARIDTSNLRRCLTIIDLTALGVGSTLGLGIYVLAGQVAKEDAGPAVVLSFFIAAVASAFAGVCYAEFGSRVPRAGSAYIYSYVTVGEFIAFVIGWNLILEYVIGAASVARGYSGYLDSLIGNSMSAAFNRTMPIRVTGLSQYPDFFAFGITFLLAVLLGVGVKESSKINNVFTVINLLVVAYTIICGAFKSDFYNWEYPKDQIPSQYDGGNGGFFPFGVSGMIAGAATCFYGFVGFDCIATTGEEAKRPQRDIPIAIVLSLFIVFLAYSGVSTVVTLMVPYFMQDEQAPIPYAFEQVGYPIAKWVVSIGALFGLSTSLLGSMFPLPRVLYAMSADGLIFRFLSRINSRFKTPFIATLIAGLFAACMALFFDTDALVDMMSIGTLLAYTLVAASVIILRYKPEELDASINEDMSSTFHGTESRAELNRSGTDFSKLSVVRQLFNVDRISSPTVLSSTIVVWGTLTLGVLLLSFNALVIFAYDYLLDKEAWAITLTCILGVCSVINGIMIGLQPANKKELAFKVPWVPFIPGLSFFVNTHLMLKLSVATWVRFGIWMVIGTFMYVFYGCVNSSEEYRRMGLNPPTKDNYGYNKEESAPMVCSDTDSD